MRKLHTNSPLDSTWIFQFKVSWEFQMKLKWKKKSSFLCKRKAKKNKIKQNMGIKKQGHTEVRSDWKTKQDRACNSTTSILALLVLHHCFFQADRLQTNTALLWSESYPYSGKQPARVPRGRGKRAASNGLAVASRRCVWTRNQVEDLFCDTGPSGRTWGRFTM